MNPPEQATRNWVKQDDLDKGRREDGLTTEERSELRRLRRENKKLKMEREILAKDRDTLWVADITYMPTHAGFLYLSVVVDAFSLRVVGWFIANPLRSELVSDDLDMAFCQRRPDEVIIPQRPGVPIHQNSLYTKPLHQPRKRGNISNPD